MEPVLRLLKIGGTHFRKILGKFGVGVGVAPRRDATILVLWSRRIPRILSMRTPSIVSNAIIYLGRSPIEIHRPCSVRPYMARVLRFIRSSRARPRTRDPIESATRKRDETEIERKRLARTRRDARRDATRLLSSNGILLRSRRCVAFSSSRSGSRAARFSPTIPSSICRGPFLPLSRPSRGSRGISRPSFTRYRPRASTGSSASR